MARDRPPALDHLRLLASAIAGRPLGVAEVDAGAPASTDGATVFLPADASVADRVQMLAVQASLLAAGSLDPEIVRALGRRPRLLRRYLAVEGHRALAANDELLPPLAQRLVDRDTAARVDSVSASVAWARGDAVVDDPSPAFGTIDARGLLAAVERRASAAGARSAPLGTPSRAAVAELDDDSDDGDGDVGHLLSSPVGGGGPMGKLLRRLLSSARGRSGGGSPGADAPTHVAAAPAGGTRGVTRSTGPGALDPGSVAFARPGRVYAEWDASRERYRPDWCTVTERDPHVHASTRSEASISAPDEIALRRSLARLGIGLTPCRRQRQGDDIDIDAAVEAHVDTVAGRPPVDECYVGSLRRRRDLAVLVLLDVSGSAGEPGTAGETVHAHQRATAAALTAALHDLGDRVALYAFNSRGRSAVQLLRVKTFDDRLDGGVARRLHALKPGAYTRLGAAIRHGTAILDEHGGTPRRLLVVLSDGFAYDHGYEGTYGEADARRALVEARRLGVGCLCLSVGTYPEEAALRRVFGAAAHATVPRTETLPRVVGPLFRAALQSAEAHRRSFQRKGRTRERLDIERRTDGRRRTPVLPVGR
jgi:hypothetical protein